MNETILLVDDQPRNLAVLFDHLDTLGYHTLVADNGIDAVEQAALQLPDLILLDVRMPGMDGYETCRALKANPAVAAVPVIFLSALADTADRLKGFEAGGVDYVGKPIEIADVTARIQTHLTLARLQRELTLANEHLEALVAERTAELEMEIAQRERQKAEKEQLLQLVREQNQQLFRFTKELLKTRSVARLDVRRIVTRQLRSHLAAIAADLQLVTNEMEAEVDGNGEWLDRIQASRLRASQLQVYLTNLDHTAQSAEQALSTAEPANLDKLTTREREVLRLLSDGLSTSAIAKELNISDITVRSYRTSLMRKLNIHHLPGLVKFALRYSLTDLG